MDCNVAAGVLEDSIEMSTVEGMKTKEKNADKEIRTTKRSGGTREQKGIEDRRLITNNQYFKHSTTASAFHICLSFISFFDTVNFC